MGSYPGMTTKALPKEGGKKGLSKPEKAPDAWVAITGEVNVATGQDELELVMASKEGNVETNADNLNVPDEAVGELATTIAWPELTLALSSGTLDIEAVFSRTPELMAGSEFSTDWATATAVSLDIDKADIDEAAVTITGAADDDWADEDEVENRPAEKLLKVEHGWDMLKKIKLNYANQPHNR